MSGFLTVLWFILVAVLWSGYLILEGFDLGVGMLLRIVAKNDKERSQVVRTIGPHWDGNEVWLLTAGGATFASSPEWYATMFSGMYLALFLILVCLILRIGAIEWRSKVSSEKWRSAWDTIHTVSAWLVPILFGVAFGNLVQGMKIAVVDPKAPFTPVGADLIAKLGEDATRTEVLGTHVHNLVGYEGMFLGPFLSLLTPYTILGGLVLAGLFLGHGAIFLELKTTGMVRERVGALAPKLSLVGTGLCAVFALWGQLVYSSQPVWGWIPLVAAALALLAATGLAFKKSFGMAFVANAVGLIGAVAWIFTAMSPYALKSNYTDGAGKVLTNEFSLTIWDSSATAGTLTVMTVAAVILVPVVLGYTVWAYLVFKARVSMDDVDHAHGMPLDKIREGANFLVG